MAWSSLLNFLSRSKKRTSRRKLEALKRTRRRRLSAEWLENRYLLSTFIGSSSGSFGSPNPANGVFSHQSIAGGTNNQFRFGTPANTSSQDNLIRLDTVSFNTQNGVPFNVGNLTYFNGATTSGSTPGTLDANGDTNFTLPISITTTFTTPSGISRTFNFQFLVTLTPNVNNNPVLDGDIVTVQNAQSSTTFAVGANQYTLRLLGFSNNNGQTIINQFDLPENQQANSSLYGKIDEGPVANADGPYTISEGQSVTLNATGTTDSDTPVGSLTYRWDVNGDGLYTENVTGVSPTLTWAQLQALGINDGPSTRTIRVEASDGANFGTATSTLTVNNAPPTASFLNGGAVNEGSAGAVSFTGPSDPSSADSTAGFRYAYDFDNDGTFDLGTGTYAGSGTAASATVPASFLADGPGTRVVRGRIIDKNDGFTDFFTSITILNVNPTALLGNGGPVNEGSNGSMSFTSPFDPSTADGAFHYAYDFDNNGTFDSGNGTYAGSGAAASAIVPASFLADGPGTRVVRGRILDKDGGSTDYTTTLTINNVNPTATFANGGSVNEASAGSVSFSSQFDPSTADGAFHYAYDFDNNGTFDSGNGTYAGSGVAASAIVPASIFADGPGTRIVKGRIIDKDGGSTDYTTTLTINNVNPTATFANGGAVNEGSAGSVSFSSQFDPSTADSAFRYAYDFNNDGVWEIGNGTYAGGTGTSASAIVPATHFADGPGSRTVKGRIIDKDGGFTDYTTTITINNVPPANVNLSVSMPVADSVSEFSGVQGQDNWRYGYYGTAGNSGSFTPMGYNASGQFWAGAAGSFLWSDGGHPGFSGGTDFWVARRWVSEVTGTVTITGTLAKSVSGGFGGGAGINGRIYVNGSQVYSQFIAGNDLTGVNYSVTVPVSAGQNVDFLIDTNGDPSFDSTKFTATISAANVATAGIVEGNTITLTGTFTDPGTPDTHTIVIDWNAGGNLGGPGEGMTTLTTAGPNPTGTTVTSLGNGNWRFTAKHQYQDDNPTGTSADAYSIGVTVTDDDGGASTPATAGLTVNNVAPTFEAGANETLNPPQAGAFSRGPISFTDPGTIDVGSGTVDYGDGTTEPLVINQVAHQFTLNHIYATEGTFPVLVSLSDDDGGTSTDTFNVTVILNQAPTITANSGAVSTAEGTPATNSGTFSDLQGNGTVVISASVGTVTQNNGAGTWSWSIPTTDGPAGPSSVTITATDNFGITATTTFTYTVNNVAPSLTTTGAAEADEGAVYTLNLSSSDPGADTIQSWTINWGDSTEFVTGNPAFVTHTYADGLVSYTISATATDEDGTYSANSQAITVLNVAPSLTISWDPSVEEGSVYTLNLAASDPGTDTISSWLIQWGDGPAEFISGNPSSVTHTYADGLVSYTISATATDEDGTYSANTQAVTVDNVAPTLTISGDPGVEEGSSYTLNLASFDPGTDTISSWLIQWGDGPAELISGNPSSVTHTYADGLVAYTISATATDEDGTYSAGNTQAVTIDNVAPTLTISGDPSVEEGSVYTLNLASSDPGTDTIQSWLIHWGDGPAELISGNPSSVTHAYADGLVAYTISATATDEDGTYSAGNTQAVTVQNVAPTITEISGPQTINESQLVIVSGTFSDPAFGAATETFTGTAVWSDGATTVVTIVGGTFSTTRTFSDDHPTLTASDLYSVTITISDDDLGSDSEIAQVTVNNVDPILASLTNSSPDCGEAFMGVSPVTIAGAFTDVGTFDTHNVLINWGDGTTPSPGAVTGSGGSGTVSGSHVYARGGIFTITVTLTDDDGGAGVATTTTVVGGVGLSPTGELQIIGTEGRDKITIKRYHSHGGSDGDCDHHYWHHSFDYIVVKAQFNDSCSSCGSDGGSDHGSDGGSDGCWDRGSDGGSDHGSDGGSDGGWDHGHSHGGHSHGGHSHGGHGHTRTFVFRTADVTSIRAILCGCDDEFVMSSNLSIPAYVDGGEGDDEITTAAGNDTIVDMLGNNEIHAGAGLDTVTTGGGHDDIWGGSGNDVIDAGDGVNEVDGDDGNDNILTGSGNDKIWGGDGNDLLKSGAGNDSVYGQDGHDTIVTYAGIDYIEGGSGNDKIWAGEGNDTLKGGSGHDILLGEDGNDVLTGDEGRDLVIGGKGADSLTGSKDDDLLVAGTTAFDVFHVNNTALLAILNEWTSSRSYSQRIFNLSNGRAGGTGTAFGSRANGNTFLYADNTADQTVFNDLDKDILTGNQDQDWYFAQRDTTGGDNALIDTVNKDSGETVTDTDL